MTCSILQQIWKTLINNDWKCSQELKAKAAISEREGHVDNKTKIELIKEEEKRIQEERAEQREEAKRILQEKAEELVDKAPIIKAEVAVPQKEPEKEEISTNDLVALEDALDTLAKEKKRMIVEKEELSELKEELQDYQEVCYRFNLCSSLLCSSAMLI